MEGSSIAAAIYLVAISATNGGRHLWMVGISMDGALTIAGANTPTYPSPLPVLLLGKTYMFR